jgi:hypothetical protein
MKNRKFLRLAAMIGTLQMTALVSAGTTSCTYNGTSYSEGSVTCQNGWEYRCNNGGWSATGARCDSSASIPDQVVAMAKQLGVTLPETMMAGKFVRMSAIDRNGKLLILASEPSGLSCTSDADAQRARQAFIDCYGKDRIRGASVTLHCFQVLAQPPYEICGR